MPDRHKDPTVTTVRAPREEKDAVTEAMAQRGWTVADVLMAALRWVLSDPDEALKLLAPFRPDPKPKGRPRKTD